MEEKSLESISELEEEVQKLRELVEASMATDIQSRPKLLFRGHSDREWQLETTLERYDDGTYTVNRYNHILWATSSVVSSHTGKSWIVDRESYKEEEDFLRPPNYEYMAHSRHLGFPSPLLDWTRSMYIALYFAYSSARKDKQISIMVYIETLSPGKVGILGAPKIVELGPFLHTHSRHFAQQGQYTVCVKKDSDHWEYCPHNNGFLSSKGKKQDMLYKFALPGCIKDEVLFKLHEMNINEYTIYGSEDALFKSLAFQEITMRNSRR